MTYVVARRSSIGGGAHGEEPKLAVESDAPWRRFGRGEEPQAGAGSTCCAPDGDDAREAARAGREVATDLL